MSTRHEFDRIPIIVQWDEKAKFKETYGGRGDRVTLEGQLLKPKDAPASKTALLAMHPSGLLNMLPMMNALAAAGIPILCGGSRYPKNDTALIMEKVAMDMGAYVRHLKEKLGYEKVVLMGWSGGGSLSLFYQSEAEDPSITHTPAGDECDLTAAKLLPADGIMQVATHVARSITLTEWMDASILDENDPDKRDPSLDIFSGEHGAPLSADFISRYRAAQIARSKRIDDWVWDRLEKLKTNPRGEMERCFVVHGTKADIRWVDPAIDPNDRIPNWTSSGAPGEVNMSPAGLGRYSSLRSWLSQWSFTHSRADGPKCASRTNVPVLVVENSADEVCTPSHLQRIYDGIKHNDKEKHLIKGATHYYFDQRDKLAESVGVCADWLRRKNFIDA
jgi:pimeloyl-ACP methyl ester carboxylesterase